MPYYLGIDGGGTKTTCAVGDESRLLATATAGPSNIVRVGEVNTRESLRRSVLQACAAAGIAPAQVARTCVGGSGAGRPELAEIVRRILAEILPSPIIVVGDMQSALEAAFDTGPGVVVNAGTGSFAYGRNSHGNTMRAGGWGFAIGDEGSAHWVGHEAVRAVLQESERVDDASQFVRTSLVQGLFKTWGVSSFLDLARAGNSVPPPDFAALFPAVAASQDEIAQNILRDAGRELARLAQVVIRKLFGKEEAVVPVAITGGAFRHSELVREVFYNELRELEPRAQVASQVVESVEGALRLARRAQG
ncbi:MAG TPA: BadF/BadG/BcrA/BcrD ATPase family protein [Candidatus Sulfotelmatobacter sp.]|nr:BadF/BadG/BcrA/BcrD ATPase family protein [Candidatus Sulfotelmatobacter sp.]